MYAAYQGKFLKRFYPSRLTQLGKSTACMDKTYFQVLARQNLLFLEFSYQMLKFLETQTMFTFIVSLFKKTKIQV